MLWECCAGVWVLRVVLQGYRTVFFILFVCLFFLKFCIFFLFLFMVSFGLCGLYVSPLLLLLFFFFSLGLAFSSLVFFFFLS